MKKDTLGGYWVKPGDTFTFFGRVVDPEKNDSWEVVSTAESEIKLIRIPVDKLTKT